VPGVVLREHRLPGQRSMSDRDDFIAWTQGRLRDAEIALHNGDPAPRLAIWSNREPVSVLGAWRSAVGQQAIRQLFHSLVETFSDCTSHVYEIVSAEVVGDMAFTVGYERTQASINGEPRQYVLRVTQVYPRGWRLEGGPPTRRHALGGNHQQLARHPGPLGLAVRGPL
jgi:hypothetical protein